LTCWWCFSDAMRVCVSWSGFSTKQEQHQHPHQEPSRLLWVAVQC
jgi:hypothetical protein